MILIKLLIKWSNSKFTDTVWFFVLFILTVLILCIIKYLSQLFLQLILSACSPFFRRILNHHAPRTLTTPVLYLKGVRHAHLTAILDFMYHGEVNVAQDELKDFLQVRFLEFQDKI